MGALLQFSSKIERGQRSGPARGASSGEPKAPLPREETDFATEMIRSARKLGELACAVDDLHEQLPEGPFKDEFKCYWLDTMASIIEAILLTQRAAGSHQPKLVSSNHERLPHDE